MKDGPAEAAPAEDAARASEAGGAPPGAQAAAGVAGTGVAGLENRPPNRLADLARFGMVALAGVLLVGAFVLPSGTSLRVPMLVIGIVLLSAAWLAQAATGRSLEGRLREATGRLEHLDSERSEIARLLDAATSSELRGGVAADIRTSLGQLCQALGAEAAACYMLDAERVSLRPEPAAVGISAGALTEVPLEVRADDPINTVVASGEPLVAQGRLNSINNPGLLRLLPRTVAAQSLLLAPMIVEDRVEGIVVLASATPDKFTDRDVKVAMATAADCGAALLSQKLLANSRQQLRHSTVIKELALAVNSTLELGHILHLFLGKARGIIDYDRAAVVLFDDQAYRLVALVDTDGNVVARADGRTHGPLAGSVYERVRAGSIIERDVLGEQDEYATERPSEMRLGHAYSEVLVPLRTKGEVAGCVAFRCPRAGGFSQALYPTLYEVANLGGMAISNSILHGHTASQARHLDLLLNSLSEVSRMLTATTEGPEALERRVVETVAKLFNSPVAVLTRVTEAGHVVVATHGAGGHASGGERLQVVAGAGLVGSIALQRGPLRMSEVARADLVAPLHDVDVPATGGMGAPMFLDDSFHGVLAVFGERPYEEGDAAVLATVANQVAVAIRNAELFFKSQRTLWELTNLHQGLQAIASSLQLSHVLDQILSKAAAVTGAQIGSIMLIEDERLVVRATYGTDTPTSKYLTFGIGEGIAGKVVQSGEAILANDVALNPHFRQAPPGMIVPKALLCVPMKVGDRIIGVINLSNYLRTNVFDDDGVRVITSLANQTSIAVENARLYEDLRSERDRLISLEEVLRQDLARDLHDGPVQRLAGMAMNIEVIRTLMERNPARARQELDELDKLVRLTIKEARTMLFELRPLVLETQGLPAAVESYAEQFEANTGLHIEFDAEEALERMPPAVEQTMFSVIQEAMGNIRKHAQAQNIGVTLRMDRERFLAEVTDDGRGFDVEATQDSYAERESQSLGLVNMTERAERIGGKLKIDSTPGRGTTVTITVPRRHLELRASSA